MTKNPSLQASESLGFWASLWAVVKGFRVPSLKKFQQDYSTPSQIGAISSFLNRQNTDDFHQLQLDLENRILKCRRQLLNKQGLPKPRKSKSRSNSRVVKQSLARSEGNLQ